MNKKIYVVRGSEDGNLGAYSNAKRAHARALDYLNQNGEVKTVVSFIAKNGNTPSLRTMPANYRNVCIKLADAGSCEIEILGDRVTAQIELFYLNS